MIITRTNDRRLRLTPTDWVRNGDRWTITQVGKQGDLTVRHTRSHHTVRLPADYVCTSTGLGYATTIHAAQGVTADTMHGLATGLESRQQLYTMLTRGRAANHLYLQIVGDGDPHSLIRPETVAPRTPTETLQQILARDDTPTSATTLLRELNDPATRLCAAVQRYTDSVHLAAEHLVGPRIVQMLDGRADQIVPYLTSEPSWPTLRANLIVLAAETGEHPLVHLYEAALGRDLSAAEDMAAVLNWRLPEPTSTNGRPPLPWLPGIPQAINDHPDWRQYLARRSQLIADLADHVRHHADDNGTQPHWVPQGSSLSAALFGEVAVWRAANGIGPHDRRPTGPEQLPTASAEWQQQLDRSIADASDYPANFDFRRQVVGSTTEGGRHEDRHHGQRPSKINQRSGPPGPSL
ncbi:MAG TPA: hypothetical protein VFP81_00175 [Propionibacteriaceae bacterium]|nr:hypothetical protein [Propionibacteriaceae bacterium]